MIGDVLLFNYKGMTWYPSLAWYSALQRFFTKMPYTHTAVGAGKAADTESILEADHLVLLNPVSRSTTNKDIEYEIWETNLPEGRLKEIISQLYNEFSGEMYGYTQILWFAFYRYIYESMNRYLKTNFDVRKHKNWFVKGVICSELLWYYFDLVGDDYPELKEFINQWSPNTFHAGDTAVVVHAFPNIFRLKEKRPIKA